MATPGAARAALGSQPARLITKGFTILLNALSIDVEDYYQVTAFERQIARAQWERFDSRVVPNTQRILKILDRRQVPATFFVLGWVARRFPQLVREIQRAGHEIGSHSYWHRLIYHLTPEQFRADLLESLEVLQDILGDPVTAYRAPSFSLTDQSRWALEILCEAGIRCDSSIFPVRHDRYGIPDAQPFLHQIATAKGRLWEFPPSVLRLGGVNLPISGGGYFRLYPLALSRWGLSRVNRLARQPCMFYIHPWELDPEQPRMAAGSRLGRFRHYVGLSGTEAKFESLLRHFQFGRMDEVIRLSQSPDGGDGQENGLAAADAPAVVGTAPHGP